MEFKINVEDVANPKEISLLNQLECPIDYQISFNPIVCVKCETIFCQNCIDDWKKKSNVCPVRCSPFEVYNPGESIIRQQLRKIKIFCGNKVHGCEEHILATEIKIHEKICQYTPLKCDLCGKDKIPKTHYMKHLLEECQKNIIKCISCDYFYSPENYTNHLRICCKNRINCEYCNDFHTNESEKNSCLYNIISCSKCQMPDLRIDLLKYKHICLEQHELNDNSKVAIYILYLRKKIIDYNEEFSKSKEFNFDSLNKKFTNIISTINEKAKELNLIPGNPVEVRKLKDEQLKKELDIYKDNLQKINFLEDEIYSLTKQVEGIYFIKMKICKRKRNIERSL